MKTEPLLIPSLPQRRPWGNGRRKRMSLAMGVFAVMEPDGSIAWQQDDWSYNALHDAGEQKMLQVFLGEQANVSKYLGLLNDASIAETDGTMTAVTESKTPGADGYARQQITSGEWTDEGLQGGDYRFAAVEKTFGAISGTAATATHVSLSTTDTGAGILLLTVALSATTTIAVGQYFKSVLRWAQQ
jgi:hypothetical protein